MEVQPDRLLEPDIPPPVTVVAADDAAAEDLLRRAALWDRAIEERDEVAAAELLAPEFALELVQPVRSVMTRDVWLEVLADYVVHEWDVEEQNVDVDGDYAAHLQRVRMQATVMGEDRSGIFVISDLWRRIDGEWRIWRRHSTPLSAGQLGGPASGPQQSP
jgi:ketosteroid isomerase-like protein